MKIQGARIRRGLVLTAATVAALLPLTATSGIAHATASSATSVAPGDVLRGEITYVRGKSTPAAGFIAPRATSGPTRVSSAHSSFVVTYDGFPESAKASFQKAVDLWSNLVSSSVPIRVTARWQSLPTGVLGGAGPWNYVRNFPGAPMTNTWYPNALANAKAGQDLFTDEPDIEAVFNSGESDWYFGSDGQTPIGKMDFTSVVLHELGHGLGLVDSVDIASGKGSWGQDTGSPFIYDRFVQNSGGTSIVSLPNNSTTLAAAVQSNALRWGGAQAVAANGGTKPSIYSPNPFQYGSSVAHLDELTYDTGNPNSLMTPYIDDGEAIFDPGDIGLGLMRDMGWTTAGAKGLPGAATLNGVVGGNQKIQVNWKLPTDTGRQFLTAVRVYRFDNGASTPSATLEYPTTQNGVLLLGLTNGTSYRFSVAAVNASGQGAASAKSDPVVPVDTTPFSWSSSLVEQQFRDFLGRAPSLSEYAVWSRYLDSGEQTPGQVVAGIAALPDSATQRARMTRLYSAYFARLPDFGGFKYWVGKLRAGTSLKKVSDTFAASSEFKTKYGSLTNTNFVKLVYTNVLHRQPDSGGLNYWVKKLNAKTISRGSVMLNFSESSENTRKMASETTSVLIHAGMQQRMPTASEYAADVAKLDGGQPASALATPILALSSYAARITP